VSRLTKKQIEFIKYLYSYVEDDEDLDSFGIDAIAGNTDLLALTVFWSEEGVAWSIPHLADKGYIDFDDRSQKILFESWKNICDQLDLDVKKEFDSYEEFEEIFRKNYY
jgi:hypothetical protein